MNKCLIGLIAVMCGACDSTTPPSSVDRPRQVTGSLSEDDPETPDESKPPDEIIPEPDPVIAVVPASEWIPLELSELEQAALSYLNSENAAKESTGKREMVPASRKRIMTFACNEPEDEDRIIEKLTPVGAFAPSNSESKVPLQERILALPESDLEPGLEAFEFGSDTP